MKIKEKRKKKKKKSFSLSIDTAGDFNNTKVRDNPKPHFITLPTLLDSYNLIDIFIEKQTLTDTAHTSAVTKILIV